MDVQRHLYVANFFRSMCKDRLRFPFDVFTFSFGRGEGLIYGRPFFTRVSTPHIPFSFRLSHDSFPLFIYIYKKIRFLHSVERETLVFH